MGSAVRRCDRDQRCEGGLVRAHRQPYWVNFAMGLKARRSWVFVRSRTSETTARNPPREAKGYARRDESESKAEGREEAGRCPAQVLLRLGQFSGEQRPCGACAVFLMEGRSTDQRVRTYCRDGAVWTVDTSTRE